MEEAVGQWSAKLFVKEYEQERHFDALVGKLVGVALSVTLQQAVRFQLAEVVTELIQLVAVHG